MTGFCLLVVYDGDDTYFTRSLIAVLLLLVKSSRLMDTA